ncbi:MULTISPECIES: small multi-drug export protein [Bacillaceae]|uniref:Small multi-drug export protein n=1 Tax=Evansella alkalicola TaxID=745819 RepID=A0ABS6K2B8_9BACI|nr:MULTISPECIES: small multi-drug export protein [Bacillaceae]MBU9723840.1 small multi-drug export protein [Bacillus alkalicola]
MEILHVFWPYILVFIFAATPFFEAFTVIPLGIFVGLPIVPVFILGITGNVLTVLLVILFINKIKEWRRKRSNTDEEKPTSKRALRAQTIWKKYGLPGLALIGPLFVGSHLTAFMSISLGGTKRKVAYWMTASMIIWSITFTILVYYGIDFLGIENRNLFDNINGN